MPEFRFALIHGDRQVPLAPRVELRDGHAACAHAEAAVRQVFQDMKDISEWSDWHVSVRDKDDGEFALLSITDTLMGERRAVGT
jgi:hypothetical protein